MKKKIIIGVLGLVLLLVLILLFSNDEVQLAAEPKTSAANLEQTDTTAKEVNKAEQAANNAATEHESSYNNIATTQEQHPEPKQAIEAKEQKEEIKTEEKPIEKKEIIKQKVHVEIKKTAVKEQQAPPQTRPQASTVATVNNEDDELMNTLGRNLRKSMSAGPKQTRQANNTQNTTIQAVVHAEQTVKVGDRVKFRTIRDGYISGILVPENTFIYGTVNSLQEQRILLRVQKITVNGDIIDVNQKIYDATDGHEGIFVRGLALTQPVKESANGIGTDVATAVGGVTGNLLGRTVSKISTQNTVQKATIIKNKAVTLQ